VTPDTGSPDALDVTLNDVNGSANPTASAFMLTVTRTTAAS
jgi:hypothetical protein